VHGAEDCPDFRPPFGQEGYRGDYQHTREYDIAQAHEQRIPATALRLDVRGWVIPVHIFRFLTTHHLVVFLDERISPLFRGNQQHWEFVLDHRVSQFEHVLATVDRPVVVYGSSDHESDDEYGDE
jgi:hypothetical protein